MKVSDIIIQYEEQKIPFSFWMNPDKPIGKRIFKAVDEHLDYIYDYPEVFGLTKTKVNKIKQEHMGYVTDQWVALVSLAFDNGWVRGGKSAKGIFLQSQNWKQCYKCAKILNNIEPFYELIIDSVVDDYTMNGIKLSGERLEYYMKHGDIPSKMVIENSNK